MISRSNSYITLVVCVYIKMNRLANCEMWRKFSIQCWLPHHRIVDHHSGAGLGCRSWPRVTTKRVPSSSVGPTRVPKNERLTCTKTTWFISFLDCPKMAKTLSLSLSHDLLNIKQIAANHPPDFCIINYIVNSLLLSRPPQLLLYLS